jgi:DNA repair protein RecN (Recombination protein N)
MLKRLHIRNFVIIDEVDLQFSSGMTVFTGETGAGKSILIDALGLVLGDRADTSIIRDNNDQAEIVATFDVADTPRINPILDEQAICVDDNELTLRRVVGRDGRSRAFANGSSIPVQLLRDLAEFLIDIHGQHAHQSLMKREVQRGLLDTCAGHTRELDATRDAWHHWHTLTRRLEQITSGAQDHESTITLLQYQVQELDELALEPDEYERLDEEHKRLANASRLLETGQSILSSLRDNENPVGAQLHDAIRGLKELLKFDSGLRNVIELLETASIQVTEAADELAAYTVRMDLDPERLNQVERRLDKLLTLSRKHHVRPQELFSHLQKLHGQLTDLQKDSSSIETLQQEQAQALKRYQLAAEKLHKGRVKAAKSMAATITGQLQRLGMPDGAFTIDINQADAGAPQAEGMDQIEYLVSLNPGQSPQPLRKVASGGELSRISLAIQITGKDDKTIPTMIFDEVDAGIGGGTAEIVGKLLSQLSKHRQVFCVTHLPQVAAQGDHHVQVSKVTDKKATYTNVTPLRADDRVEEIARMLGGVKISDKTRAHAKEMLGIG